MKKCVAIFELLQFILCLHIYTSHIYIYIYIKYIEILQKKKPHCSKALGLDLYIGQGLF